MARLGCFVFVYSVILLIIFGVFCYLISTVNPTPPKQDSRKSGTDHFVYSDEVFGDDVAAYGLEKAIDYYNSFDIFPRSINKNPLYRGLSTPQVYIDQTFKTNNTKKEFQLVTKSMKQNKGLRRSIYDENEQSDELLKLIHLKIKNVNGHPKIEIEVVPDKCKSKESRKNRRSNIINNKDNGTDIDTNNDSDEVFIELVQNETIVLNFDEKIINVTNSNIKEEDLLLKSFTTDKISDRFDNNTKLYKLNLLATEKSENNHQMTDNTENTKDIKHTTACVSTKNGSNGTRLMKFLFNSIYKKNKTVLPFNIYNITTTEETTDDEEAVSTNSPDNTLTERLRDATATN